MSQYPVTEVAKVNSGSTAYVAGNDAVAIAADSAKRGVKRIRVTGAVDAAVIPILRIGGVNENAGFTCVANVGFDAFHDIPGNVAQAGYSVRFSGNCNILRLLVTEEDL